ncbi:MAG: hypothetical protein IT508_12925, partial [Burkholderiaceae bacterium]|nr:hypothetical protein [Burkholderiaceae bacterium]
DGSVKGNSIIKENSSNTGTGRDLTSSREQSIAENAVTVTDIDGDGLADRSILSVKGIVADINRLTKGRVPGIAVSLSNKGINEAGIKYTGDADNKVIEKATSGLKDNIRTNVRVTGTTPPLWEAPEMKQTDHWGDPHENVNGKQGIPNKTENEALSKGQRSSSPLSSKIIRVPDGDMLVLSAHPDRYPGNLKEMPATEPVRGAAIWFEGEDGKVYKKITDNQGVVNLMDLPVGQTLSLSVNLMLSGEEDIMIHFPASNSNQNVAARVLKTKHDTVKNSINNIR